MRMHIGITKNTLESLHIRKVRLGSLGKKCASSFFHVSSADTVSNDGGSEICFSSFLRLLPAGSMYLYATRFRA